MSTTQLITKMKRIEEAIAAMPVGACGVKWDCVVWRVSEAGWIVGETGVRKDGVVHSFDSVCNWLAWKRESAK